MQRLLPLMPFLCITACNAESKENPPIYGNWIISDSVDSTGISALSSQEIKAMNDKPIFLGENFSKFANETCSAVTYDTTYIDREKLLHDIHYADSRDPNLPPQVTQVDVGCTDIFLRSDGKIMFVWGGDIFVAKRR